jgi:UDP-4-amino-4,6-dideoxy-N-acetyl-beta-L-altrosamine N-acetyltransferase
MVSFREVTLDDAQMIFDWRNKPRVDAMMRTKMDPDFDKHLRWLAACYDRPDYYHWIMQEHGRDVGLVSVNAFSADRSSTSWGFYVGEDDSLGVGSTVPAHMYNWIFSRLEFENVTAEVLEKNTQILRMHAIYGFRRRPELDLVISRYGSSENLLALNLSHSDWANQARFSQFTQSFPVTQWRAAPSFVVS